MYYWSTIRHTNVLHILVIVLCINLVSTTYRNTMFLCYDTCETNFNVCLSQTRKTTKKTVNLWVHCVNTKSKCTKDCRNDCWLQCKVSWKSCFKLHGISAVQSCMKVKQLQCALDCAVKKRMQQRFTFLIATSVV